MSTRPTPAKRSGNYCATCGAANRLGAAFCKNCGQRLCTQCGTAINDSARYCNSCGHPQEASPGAGEQAGPDSGWALVQGARARSLGDSIAQSNFQVKQKSGRNESVRSSATLKDRSSQSPVYVGPPLRNGVPVTARGRVRNFKSEQVTVSVAPSSLNFFWWTFIVDVFDEDGNIQRSIAIEMRRSANRRGFISDGDEVEIFDSFGDQQILITRLFDVTKGTWIEGDEDFKPKYTSGQKTAGAIILSVILLCFLAVFLTMLLGTFFVKH